MKRKVREVVRITLRDDGYGYPLLPQFHIEEAGFKVGDRVEVTVTVVPVKRVERQRGKGKG